MAGSRGGARANLPRAAFGATLAHAGVGVMVIGIVATTAWRTERIGPWRRARPLDIAGYDLDLRGRGAAPGPQL